MTDMHLITNAVAAELERARLHLEAAATMAQQRGLRGYATKINKEIERVKAIEWPLRGVHPDDASPPRT